jgi:nitroimidazol reductase NimA-like FMN-containing flavoprotein (pyridoxamine 5'-phosphate oxidase superfamily)
MDKTIRETISAFLAQYDTLAIATEYEGQPYVTRAFYAEQIIQDDTITLYGTFIKTSRKLANLRLNPRVGLFIGPSQPTAWLEATATAEVLTDEAISSTARDLIYKKSAVAAAFIARVPIVAVALRVKWLRMTDIAANPMQIEVTFDTAVANQESNR